MRSGTHGFPSSGRQPWKLLHARLILQPGAQRLQDCTHWPSHRRKLALQLVGVEKRRAHALDLPKQRENVG